MAEKHTNFNEKIGQGIHASFRFVVEIGGDKQGVFTECTPPSIEWEIEEIKEGGQNNYVHQLPARRKSARMTLKNGIVSGKLQEWYFSTMSPNKEMRKTVLITLLDARDKEKKAIMTWEIEEAYPVKWTGPQLKTSDNTIALQTLELACGYIKVT